MSLTASPIAPSPTTTLADQMELLQAQVLYLMNKLDAVEKSIDGAYARRMAREEAAEVAARELAQAEANKPQKVYRYPRVFPAAAGAQANDELFRQLSARFLSAA